MLNRFIVGASFGVALFFIVSDAPVEKTHIFVPLLIAFATLKDIFPSNPKNNFNTAALLVVLLINALVGIGLIVLGKLIGLDIYLALTIIYWLKLYTSFVYFKGRLLK